MAYSTFMKQMLKGLASPIHLQGHRTWQGTSGVKPILTVSHIQ